MKSVTRPSSQTKTISSTPITAGSAKHVDIIEDGPTVFMEIVR